MSQQRLARSFFSLAALPRPHRVCFLSQESQLLQRRPALSQYSTDTSAPTPPIVPSAILSKIKPDTRRRADRSSPRRSSEPAPPTFRAPTNTATKSKWDKATDNEIIRLFKKGTPWKEIDETLGRPYSSCYARYYTALDPRLEATWNLSDGRPNEALLKRLVYLVDVEKQSFGKIERRGLMHEPWETPTSYAPQELLTAMSEAGIDVSEAVLRNRTDMADQVQKQQHGKKKERDSTPQPFNKLALQQKYMEHKASLQKTAVTLNKHLLHRAIRRSVELYGENWKKVAANADLLLDQWTLSKAWTNTETPTETQKPKQQSADGATIPERMALSPSKVASTYRMLQRHGVDWGLEDDVVMTRKVLELSRTEPSILKILSMPLPLSVEDSHTRLGQDQKQQQQQKYWGEISVALGNHSPAQCKRRWDGLWRLQDDEKSAQSKMWHWLEKFQFWMLWKHYYQVHKRQNHLGSVSRIDTLLDLERACNELSFAKEISKWMRHRNEALCEKFFTTSANLRLHLGISNADIRAYKSEIRQRRQQMKTEGVMDLEQAVIDVRHELAPVFRNKTTFMDSIFSQVAEPFVQEMSTLPIEKAQSTQDDPPLKIVRSEWTKERIQALRQIVLEEKQGVQRADFELDWNRIAEQLEDMFIFPADASSDNSATFTVAGSSVVVDTQHQRQYPYISAKQCETCWKYISSPTGRASSNRQALTAASETDEGKSVSDGKDGDFLQNWTDHELELLLQGVRKRGTAWTDIRAQFLPNKNASDIHRAWLSISAPLGDEDREEGGQLRADSLNTKARKVDRLSEWDYVGLLSALDKVSGKNQDRGSDGSNKAA
ncbi:hypothetical protein BC939DRAFT_437439 [Gamsiella multidivaricata]|uniref:uncharacterized protein n=1 Tax=Gamsiella multidivaricata TaxID=101098 RepID=UPI002220440B|nr:uncharacterized protein BC939DRAFT_437439 [Gamsiella multidivaricata]KAG0355769.1 hypothetical protein BGZ54_001022 [Gamsiella multidivaricata]KAI7831565.1 hypothetical protein BC939DRAFT_437439 [Gamsiella multidivaricata]